MYISLLGLRPEIENLLTKERFNKVDQLLWLLADNPGKGFLAINGMDETAVKELEDALKEAGVKIRISAPESLICEIVAEDVRHDAIFYFLHNNMSPLELFLLDYFLKIEIADETIRQAVRLYYGVGVGTSPKTFDEVGRILGEDLPRLTVSEGIEQLRHKGYASVYTEIIEQRLR